MGKEENNTDEMISRLPEDKILWFEQRLLRVLNHKDWFVKHRMDYSNPDTRKIKEIIFREEYEKYLK